MKINYRESQMKKERGVTPRELLKLTESDIHVSENLIIVRDCHCCPEIITNYSVNEISKAIGMLEMAKQRMIDDQYTTWP